MECGRGCRAWGVERVGGVYQEFLNFKDDQDMVNLIKKIAKPSSKLLADMSIDFNNPGSILKISENVSILVGLLKSYVSVETPFSVRVPLGLILITCEIITTINVKFLSFKGDVRDEQIKKLIKVTLVENYRSVIGLLSQLTTIYQGALVPHIPTIWSFLETLIPYKNKRIVDAEIVESEHFLQSQPYSPTRVEGLLVDAVLCPGYEKVSVLPIVSSILGAQSQVLSVFNNPRFPALPKYINSVGDEGIIEEEEEDDEEEEAEVKRPVEELTDEHPTKKRKVNEEGVVERKVEVTKEDVPVEDKPQLFSKESIQVEELQLLLSPKQK
ncbi:Pre-rRNA-processing protein RIX1 [Candida viswanathii]|uniref:Pre-rRNA-processing protein RIX1 n=1 Tax=Candida viswanathii TaxID=5486 RepID=A0A367XV61_9ASCO|nr:Pre-rRNA-processing protein RIX1 [Candida viswanathii]